MVEDAGTVLECAAENYVADRLSLYPFPENPKVYRLLMEVAFMEGAQWHTKHQRKRLERELDRLKSEMASMAKEVTNAQS